MKYKGYEIKNISLQITYEELKQGEHVGYGHDGEVCRLPMRN